MEFKKTMATIAVTAAMGAASHAGFMIVALSSIVAVPHVMWAGQSDEAASRGVEWTLAFTEDFNGPELDGNLWSRIDKGWNDWNRHMSTREDLVAISGGQLHLHGARNEDPSEDPQKGGGRGKINLDGWNVCGLEWTPDAIVWTVNGEPTHSYRKVDDDPVKFPWTKAFYLMVDMQLGGEWVGEVDESTLPVSLHVDWIKFYERIGGRRRFQRIRASRRSVALADKG